MCLNTALELLVKLRQRIKTDGLDEEQDGSLLTTIYGDSARPHLRRTLHYEYLVWFETAKATEEDRLSEEFATPEQCKQEVLRQIGAEVKRLKRYQRQRELIESERMKVEILRQGVSDFPGIGSFTSLQGSALERDFDRTLTQLELGCSGCAMANQSCPSDKS